MKKLVIGCGYLGVRVAQLWQAAGHSVSVTTRRELHAARFREAGFHALICDVLDASSLKALTAADTVLYSIGLDRISGRSMREIYLVGLGHVLNALPAPQRFLYISSTGVYGQSAGDDVDEGAATEPADESGRIVLESEGLVRSRLPSAVILRFAGIYGPGRVIQSGDLLAGRSIARDPRKWLNLIHVDDGARAVLAAEERAQAGATYNVSDDLPVTRGEYYQFVAKLLNAPAPKFADSGAGQNSGRQVRPNRRIKNRRMHDELGVQLRYPTYREGVRAAVCQQSDERY